MNQPELIFDEMKDKNIIDLIISELRLAEKKYPRWPDDLVHGAAIIGEEVGEIIRATLNNYYHGDKIENIKKEAVHTAVTAIRLILFLNRNEKKTESRSEGKSEQLEIF
jgi:hypothetical protein